MHPSKSKKTITRTFRIKECWDLILQEEAERQNISSNALMDKILRRFALYDRYANRLNILNLPDRILRTIIEFLPDERVVEEAEKFGALDAVDFFNSLGYAREYETFVYLVKEHFGGSEFARWFQCFYHKMEIQDLFHLQHDLGRKWSLFVDSYLRTILKTTTNTHVDSRIYKNAVTLKVSRPPTMERKNARKFLRD